MELIGLFLLFVVLSSQEDAVCGSDVSRLSRRELISFLLNKTEADDKKAYDPRVPPEYEKDVPTNVTIKLFLLSFDSVSETTMDYSVEIYLTMSWIDERLIFLNYSNSKWLEIDTKLMADVWVPDVYFRNEKDASFHEVTVPNKYMHLYPDGRVRYSMRLSLTLSCRMKLVNFPLDSQNCPMLIQSYTYTTENVLFSWDEKDPITFDEEMKMDQELPQFIIENSTTEICEVKADQSSFACIKAFFTLKRDIRYYIIQVYVPSILIVVLSWVSFWLDLESIPARVSLGVLTVLTLNTHGSNVQASLPKVSYIKAIDVWTVTCLVFVFSALLEFAYVNVLTRRGEKELLSRRKNNCFCEQKITPTNKCPSTNSKVKARRVDKISRLGFPLSFIIFNIGYWFIYVYSEQD
ncbi:glycine receptor subunit alpha-2-like isoform X2 [Haliotis rufescens]|nr:glycine receptor subunit alpha-2-like isoform X2 [Haliotis rufescens]